jgi:hypothetical protein
LPALDGRDATLRIAVSVVDRRPVLELRRSILMPVQNEPNVSHHWLLASTNRFGSIAL